MPGIERLDFKVTEAQKEIIEKAAQQWGVSTATFIWYAATQTAKSVLMTEPPQAKPAGLRAVNR